MLHAEFSRDDIEKLANAIHDKHKNCQLRTEAVESNVKRILQSYRHTLWGEIFGSFEPIRHIMYNPAFEETRITEEMRNAFGGKKWWLITQRMLANSLYGTFMGLRKIIEKRNQTRTSSITVITQKFHNLLSPHKEKDESIGPFLKDLEDTTENLIKMRTKIIDPIADKFIAHTETNWFTDIDKHIMPKFKDIQDCIDLCESYYQIIYSFYLDTHQVLHHLKEQIAFALYPFLEALRISNEYSNIREEITNIAFDEECLSKRYEQIGKRLMKVIEPELYEAIEGDSEEE